MKKMMFCLKFGIFQFKKPKFTVHLTNLTSISLFYLVFQHAANFRYVANFRFLTLYKYSGASIITSTKKCMPLSVFVGLSVYLSNIIIIETFTWHKINEDPLILNPNIISISTCGEFQICGEF